jgi:hypothetical protein
MKRLIALLILILAVRLPPAGAQQGQRFDVGGRLAIYRCRETGSISPGSFQNFTNISVLEKDG